MTADLSGVWHLNLEKSKIRGSLPRRMTVRIQHHEPNIVQHVESMNADGSENSATFRFTVGIEAINSIRGFPLRTIARWEGQELLVESWMKTANRELHFKDYWSISADGRTLTMSHRDDDLDGQISVLEKHMDS